MCRFSSSPPFTFTPVVFKNQSFESCFYFGFVIAGPCRTFNYSQWQRLAFFACFAFNPYLVSLSPFSVVSRTGPFAFNKPKITEHSR